MTKYICKCGRVVAKSTNADNTGNRDTAGCEGCPYLLPWGPTQWDATRHAMVIDIKGYECRMSPTLDYATFYQGGGDDKCVLHIYSLDYDFLDRVVSWAAEQFPGKEIGCSFDRTRIRAAEFIGGLYGMSVYPMQNKKGIAAKAALLAEFFGPDKHRLDMTPEEEKAHILAAIEAGKARAQKGENKKVEYIISRNTENGLTYAYYRGAFWFWDERAGRWFLSPHAKELYTDFSAGQPGSKPEDMLCSGNFEALDDWDIPAKVIDDLLSRNPKKEKRENPTDAAEDAQPCAPTASDVPLSQSQSVDDDARQGEEDDAANPTDAAPASPADAGAATQSLSAADPASLAAESAQPAFDYSGLDDQTVADLHLAEREYSSGKKMAEMGLRRMADAVAIAHDALCGSCDNLSQLKHGNRGDESFGAWCESMGLHRKAAERLLQVSRLMDNSSPREQKVLEELTPSVLYEASRPSAEPEAVEALKQQQVKTLKEYRELEARLKAEREAKEKAQQDAAQASKREEEARAAAHQYHVKYQEANDQRNRLLDEQGVYISRITEAEEKVKAAQAEVARQKRIGMEMQEEVESRDERIRELEQSQTVVAGTADPEEIERRAREIAKVQIAENDAKWAEITENQGRQLRELRANSGASQAVKTAAASVRTILEGLFQALSLEEDDVAGQAALEDLEDLLFDWSDSIHNMLHPEDTLGYPPDDEEGNTDDET